MTAIAYRAGVMAADTAVWRGNQVVHHVHKISRINGHLIASAGSVALAARFRDWVMAGMKGDFDRSARSDDAWGGALIVMPDGVVLTVEQDGPPLRYEAPFYVLGGAQPILMGALAAGASAENAVRIAITYDDNAGGGVQVMKLRDDALEADIGGPVAA